MASPHIYNLYKQSVNDKPSGRSLGSDILELCRPQQGLIRSKRDLIRIYSIRGAHEAAHSKLVVICMKGHQSLTTCVQCKNK